MSATEIPVGHCQCGCGERTGIAKDNCNGNVVGQPKRFRPLHHAKLARAGYVEEDRGYDTPCWIWQTAVRPSGYASTTRGRWHRLFYEERVGPIPEGLVLDHLCRVKACVNPSHLEPVTQLENLRRGRVAILTADQAREIRRIIEEARGGKRRIPNGLKATLAERYGVSPSAIADIGTGKSWRDVE